MRKILRSISILLCLCLLLGVSALAAETRKVCTVEAGDLMFTLPDGMIMLDAGQAAEQTATAEQHETGHGRQKDEPDVLSDEFHGLPEPDRKAGKFTVTWSNRRCRPPGSPSS